MTTSEKSKCAHLPCRCLAQSSDKYCGEACKGSRIQRGGVCVPVRPRTVPAYRVKEQPVTFEVQVDLRSAQETLE